ncbi:MAG TPA: DUF1579 family protein [Gemmataceae bacterium]|nr:DUF1579 family protein [Gemmataceae bacterium]
MKAYRSLLCVALVAAGLLAVAESPAQDTKATPAPQGGKDMTAKEFMAKLVGDYNVVRVFYGTTPDAPKKMNGTCKQFMSYNNFLFSEFSFGEGDAKITGLGILGYQEDTGLFISNWLDSRQTKMSIRQSKQKFDGKQIELATGVAKLDKSARTSRTITVFEDDGKKVWHRQWNMVNDKEQLWMELHMTRK